MRIITIETAQLGNRSYLLHDGTSGLVVDPVRDIERIEVEAERAGVAIVAVAETHIHNDYVSGGHALARRHRADYLVAAEESVSFERLAVRDGMSFDVGELAVRVLATPGHTPHHLAFLATGGADPPALFSGGSMLYGTVGRTDLVAPGRTEALTREQYRSVRRLAEFLPIQTRVFPTHGFGSFCASGSTTPASASTLAEEWWANDALTTDDEDVFVEWLIRRLGPYPHYYTAMAPLNRAGASLIDLTDVETPSPQGLRERARSAVVLDMRSRQRFADGHVPGSIGMEYAPSFATYVGWILPWGTELTLIGESPEQLAEARLDLARIGLERVTATSSSPVDTSTHGPLAHYLTARWEGLVDAVIEPEPDRPELVVDVRRQDEYARSHLRGALSVPIHELPDRLHALPSGRLWVHCQSGYRAGIAASLLHRAGRDVVHVDDDFERARGVGLAVASSPTVSTGC